MCVLLPLTNFHNWYLLMSALWRHTWLGDDSKISMDRWNVNTKTDEWTNNHVEGWNSKFAKVLGNTIPTSSTPWLFNMMLPSYHHVTRIIVDSLLFDQCNNYILCTINKIIAFNKKLHKCFMVYFPFQIPDSYIYIQFLWLLKCVFHSFILCRNPTII